MISLAESVDKALTAAGVAAGAPVIVACSGGPDSATLAHLAMVLRREGRLGEVTLVYVDHGLRDESNADAQVVKELAAHGGGKVRVLPVDVDQSKPSLEEAAREARYQALGHVAEELAVDWVLLGHTASDQAETVLMRVLRGSGVVGLSAIPQRRGRYLRPLLEVSRGAIEEYVARNQLAIVQDPMNEDRTFLRNRVRHELLPILRRENPEIDAALCRLAAAAREQREILDFAAGCLLASAVRRKEGEDAETDSVEEEDLEQVELDVGCLTEAPDPVTKRALALEAVRAGGEPLEARHQQALLALLRRDEAGTVALSLPSLRAVREYGRLRLVRPNAVMAPPPRVSVRGPNGPYIVRKWQAGDRMRPARLKGRSRKLSDLYTDAKIPREQRSRALVVVCEADGAIEWAQFTGMAHGSEIEVTLTTPRSVARNKDNR